MSRSASLRQEERAGQEQAAQEPPAQEPAAQEGSTLRDRLRQATRNEHDALEAGLDLMRADFGMAEYRELLVQYHGFYASFEAFLLEQAGQGSAPAMFYCETRRKADWLTDDLKSLGLLHRAGEAAVLPGGLCTLFPSASHQLGAIYVLEGSMLGGRVLSRHFGKRFGLTAENGLRFFSGYGVSMPAMWNGMLHLLEEEVPEAISPDEVIAGARSMFGFLGRQLGVTQAH